MRSNSDLALVVLADATAAHAQQLAATAAAAERERVRAEREQAERVERERVERERREETARAERARFVRRDRNRRVRSTVVALVVGAVPVWIFTPVVGSIVSIFSDNVTRVIFLGGGEDGSTANSGPETLYVLLAQLMIGTIVVLAIAGLTLPYPRDQEVVSTPAGIGFAAGFGLLLVQAFSGSGSSASWWWPALFTVIGHIGYGLIQLTRTDPGRTR